MERGIRNNGVGPKLLLPLKVDLYHTVTLNASSFEFRKSKAAKGQHNL